MKKETLVSHQPPVRPEPDDLLEDLEQALGKAFS